MTDLAKVPLGMSVVLGMGILILFVVLWNFHRDKDNHIDLKDLICYKGQISDSKVARFTAFIVSTWGFVYLILDDKFSEWYFAGYMGTWVGNALFSKHLDIKGSNGPLPSRTPPNAP